MGVPVMREPNARAASVSMEKLPTLTVRQWTWQYVFVGFQLSGSLRIHDDTAEPSRRLPAPRISIDGNTIKHIVVSHNKINLVRGISEKKPEGFPAFQYMANRAFLGFYTTFFVLFYLISYFLRNIPIYKL